MEMTKDAELALLSAMDKRIKPALDDAKAAARNALLEDFQESGNDRHAILIGTTKVGEVGISYSKAQPVIKAERLQEALAFLTELGLTDVTPKKGWEQHFSIAGENVICTDTGEVVDFMLWQPSEAKTAAVRGCKPEDVLAAFQGQLPTDEIIGLLEGAN